MFQRVHVITEQKEERVVSKDDLLYVFVREAAKAGRANRRMLELLQAHFGANKRTRIISGHHSPHKVVSVD